MTTTSLILLGNYLATPFYVYTIKKKNYYNIFDIDKLFLNEQLNTKTVIIQELFKSNSMDFLKSQDKILIHTNTLIQIARLFHVYTLAELCKLSNDEILGGVSDPLLNTIDSSQWKSATTTTKSIVERDLLFESLHGNESIFNNHVTMETNDTVAVETITKPKTSLSSQQELLYRWLSTNLNNTTTHIKTLLTAQKVKKQQQAIIETRQRQVAFIIPTSNKTTNKKQQKLPTITPKSSSVIHLHDHYDNNTRKLPPSPPAIVNYTRKRKLPQQQDTTTTKRIKSNSTLSYQQYLIHHGNDNLNLLATQATQMRGLPMSPEVSPSPPPYYNNTNQQQQRLPSIQTMLSELNHHHHHHNSHSV